MARAKKAEVELLEPPAKDNPLALPGRATRTSLDLPKGLEFRQYRKVGTVLKTVADCSMWWLGDWMLYGPGAYGQMYEEAVKASGFSYSTLANAKTVAKRFGDPSRRREKLGFKHHAEVTVIKDDLLQDRLLDLAESKDWSAAALRAVVAAIGEGATLDEVLGHALGEPVDLEDGLGTRSEAGPQPATKSATLGGCLHDLQRRIM